MGCDQWVGNSLGLIQLLKHVVHVLNGKNDSPGAAAVSVGVCNKDVFKGIEPIDEAVDRTVVLKAVDVADFQRLVRVIARGVVNVRFAIVIQLRI